MPSLEAEGTVNLSAAFATVMTIRKVQSLPEQRYDIADANGIFQERYWRIQIAPILDSKGDVLFIRCEFFNIMQAVGQPDKS